MQSYSFSRYLSAKRTVDDRALSDEVVNWVRAELSNQRAAPVRVVEVGAGLCTMVARLIEWGILGRAEYVAVDSDAELLDGARNWLLQWGEMRGYAVQQQTGGVRITRGEIDVQVQLVPRDLVLYLEEQTNKGSSDLLVANAVLDLFDLSSTLRPLLSLLGPKGVYWFSINYDGETLFVPEHSSDEQFMCVYNRSMDERVFDGRPAGDSKTGRRLFTWLRQLGATVEAAGGSDWVVHAKGSSYPADEQYFLHHIINTVDHELQRHSDVAADELAEWVRVRHEQVRRGELVYVCHQLDLAGYPPQ